MVISTKTERHEFINRHGDNIGYCELTIHAYADTRYATISADMPHYSEYTRWSASEIKAARASFEQDINYYKARILAGDYDEI